MNTTEVLAGGAGLVAGGLLGSLVLAPAPMDVPLWGSTNGVEMTSLVETLKEAGIAFKARRLPSSQTGHPGKYGSPGEGLEKDFYIVLVKESDIGKAMGVAKKLLAEGLT